METDNTVLQAFATTIPFLQVLFDDEASFAVTDTERYLVVVSNELMPLKAQAGDLIPEGGAIYDALKSGEITIKKVSKEIYGIPFRSYAIPVSKGLE